MYTKYEDYDIVYKEYEEAYKAFKTHFDILKMENFFEKDNEYKEKNFELFKENMTKDLAKLCEYVEENTVVKKYQNSNAFRGLGAAGPSLITAKVISNAKIGKFKNKIPTNSTSYCEFCFDKNNELLCMYDYNIYEGKIKKSIYYITFFYKEYLYYIYKPKYNNCMDCSYRVKKEDGKVLIFEESDCGGTMRSEFYDYSNIDKGYIICRYLEYIPGLVGASNTAPFGRKGSTAREYFYYIYVDENGKTIDVKSGYEVYRLQHPEVVAQEKAEAEKKAAEDALYPLPKESKRIFKELLKAKGFVGKNKSFASLWESIKEFSGQRFNVGEEEWLWETLYSNNKISYNITRQFSIYDDGEYCYMCQLSCEFTIATSEKDGQTYWSSDFKDTAEFFEKVENTSSFKTAQNGNLEDFTITFERV